MRIRALSIFSLTFAGLYFTGAQLTEAQTQTGTAYGSYKGISVGMKADEVRSKLGKPRDTSDSEDYFVFSDNETAQVLYDTDHTARVISANYIGNVSAAPKPKDVFGADVEAKPDGSISKMVKYPKRGFWVSYVRTGGDDPMIIVTIQKMKSEQ